MLGELVNPVADLRVALRAGLERYAIKTVVPSRCGGEFHCAGENCFGAEGAT
jgi:hypothetical protein